MHLVPGPSPFLFSSSLTKRRPHPFLLHDVPKATGTEGSSSSSMTGAGFSNLESGCAGVFVEFENVSFPPSVDNWVTENVTGVFCSGAFGTSES